MVFILHAGCGVDNDDGGRGFDDNDDGYLENLLKFFTYSGSCRSNNTIRKKSGH
jgi:hypothetical protein